MIKKILIVGDNFINPELVEEGLKKELLNKEQVEFETIKFDYPEEEFPLDDDTYVPSGMSWENPKIQKPHSGVREFYGDPFALENKLKDVEILIIHGAALPRKVLEKANSLEAVVVLRGGPVNIDQDYLKERKIKMFNTDGKNAEGVAEFTIGLLLSFLRNIPESSHFLENGRWKVGYYEYDRTGVEIFNKTFGLIGFGKIARHLARILKGFQVDIVAFDPFVEEKVFTELGVKRAATIENLLGQSDFVSLHARKPKNTEVLLNERMFNYFKPNAVLINTARGDLIDYSVLKTALEQKLLRGAVLDVFGEEPFSFYKELLAMPNVLGTPHIAGGSQETVKRAIKMTSNFLNEHLNELQQEE